MLHLALLGTTEWAIILAVVILIFGGRKLPELARAMGKSITEFKQGLKGDDDKDKLEDKRDQKDDRKDDRKDDKDRP